MRYQTNVLKDKEYFFFKCGHPQRCYLMHKLIEQILCMCICRFKQQLFLDHSAVLNPNTSAAFVSVEDALRHLLPYHTCARALPNQADFISGLTPIMKFEFNNIFMNLSCNGLNSEINMRKSHSLCSGQAV